MARTDTLRPEVFDPSDFEVVRYIDNKAPEPHETTFRPQP